MGYTADRPIASLFDDAPLRRLQHNIAEDAADYLHDRVKRHTPVADVPPPYASAEDFTADRGRAPGTLKESWKIGEVEITVEATGEHMVVEVYTEDAAAPYVEWDTRPHIIVPKNPDGFLRFPNGVGGFVYAKLVNHPGTRGQHMMARGLAETQAALPRIARRPLLRWSKEQMRR